MQNITAGMADEPITLDESPGAARWGIGSRAKSQPSDVPALVIAWSLREPHRIGESCIFVDDGVGRVIGRGAGNPEDVEPRAAFVAIRPGHSDPSGPLEGHTLSRRHAVVTRMGELLSVERVGRGAMTLDGDAADACDLVDSSTLLLANEVLFICDRRPRELGGSVPVSFPFGAPDPQGLVGETPAFWWLRERIRFAAGTSASLLVTGAPGSGREAVSRAVHALSAGSRPLVAIDGSSLRADDLENLLRRDDAPTLLLDELSDVASDVQQALVRYAARVMTREPPRPRIIATTARNPDKIRPALSTRFPLTLRVPDLVDRRADIPLIARALLKDMAKEQPDIGARFFENWDSESPEPRLGPTFVMRLLLHDWAGNVRELSGILWRSVMSSAEGFLDVTPEVEQLLGSRPRAVDPSDVSAELVKQALLNANGKVALAARSLGLKSRFQLYRLMDKFDIRSS